MNATSLVEAFNLGLQAGRQDERATIIAMLKTLLDDPSGITLTGAITILEQALDA